MAWAGQSRNGAAGKNRTYDPTLHPTTVFTALRHAEVCGLDHPLTIAPDDALGLTRLASTPSRITGLGSGLAYPQADLAFPEFERYAPARFRAGGQLYQGCALPLSYGGTPQLAKCLP